MGIIGALVLFGGLRDLSVSGIIAGAVLCGLAYAAFARSKTRIYQLFLMTSSSEAQAYQSEDQVEIFNLREAIEGAMTGRLEAVS